jgi:hypothetical protein
LIAGGATKFLKFFRLSAAAAAEKFKNEKFFQE